MYKWRHLIENFFCKLKEFKRIALRADKTDQSFAAMIYLAAAVINSRCIPTDPSWNARSDAVKKLGRAGPAARKVKGEDNVKRSGCNHAPWILGLRDRRHGSSDVGRAHRDRSAGHRRGRAGQPTRFGAIGRGCGATKRSPWAARLDSAGRDGDPKGGVLYTGAGTLRSLVPKDARQLRLHDHRQNQAGAGGGDPRLWEDDRGRRRGHPQCTRALEAALFTLGTLRHRQRHVLYVPGNI